MKKIFLKIILSLSVIGFICDFKKVRAVNMAETKQVIYCDLYKGRHQMHQFGSGSIRDEGGEYIRYSQGWQFYKCACGLAIFSDNLPHKNGGILGNYMIPSKGEGVYGGYVVYKKGYGNGCVGTNAPVKYSSNSSVRYAFYSDF